jgi:predicted RNA-binding protein YlxR (DUF448 family)
VTLRLHTPIRTCMGCGRRDAQAALLRIVCDDAGNLAVVTHPRHSGRSGYLHSSADCCQRFTARKGPVRSLRRQIDRAARSRFVAGLELPMLGATRG